MLLLAYVSVSARKDLTINLPLLFWVCLGLLQLNCLQFAGSFNFHLSFSCARGFGRCTQTVVLARFMAPSAGIQVLQWATGMCRDHYISADSSSHLWNDTWLSLVQHQHLERWDFKLSVFWVGSILSHPGMYSEVMSGSTKACRWFYTSVCQSLSTFQEEVAEEYM